jgi:hypothetical protein
MSSAAELALKKKYALLQKKKQVGRRGGGIGPPIAVCSASRPAGLCGYTA